MIADCRLPIADFWKTTRYLVAYKGSKPLQVVIQVRQVNEVERRRVFIFNPLRGLGNPARGAVGGTLRRFDSCRRPPEAEEEKLAQILFYLFADGIRPSGLRTNIHPR